MVEHGNIIGGEQSGHIIMSKYLNTGDGILTALILSEVMVKSSKSLFELSSSMIDYPQVLVNVCVSSKDEVMSDNEIQSCIESVSKGLGNKGRVLVRPSGTEPVIRVMSEAETRNSAESAVETVVEMMRKKGYFKGVR